MALRLPSSRMFSSLLLPRSLMDLPLNCQATSVVTVITRNHDCCCVHLSRVTAARAKQLNHGSCFSSLSSVCHANGEDVRHVEKSGSRHLARLSSFSSSAAQRSSKGPRNQTRGHATGSKSGALHAASEVAANSSTAAVSNGVLSAEETTDTELEAAGASPNLLDVLRERGLVDNVTSEDLRVACRTPLRAYVGFDPTAESLHLGNLLGIVALAWAVRCGHEAVALMGGATARVGDPSGKSAERPVLDEAAINANLRGIEGVLRGILGRVRPEGGDAEGGPAEKVVFVNNFDWWREVSLLEFLRDVGKYARVGAMMAKESVKKRLGSDDGMSYTEFTYQLLQGYDFVHLLRHHNVSLQMGGSDQWGNITAGTDLIRRLVGNSSSAAAAASQSESDTSAASPSASLPLAFGLTWPLLLKSDGSKFGKSEGGAIWLSAAMLSPYKFYQYLFATPDADVIKFLKMLTFLEIAKIHEIEQSMKDSSYLPNTAQKILAEEVTRFVHGQEGLQDALKATLALAPGSKTQLDVASLEAIAGDVPSVVLPPGEVEGRSVVDVGVAAKLFASKGAARRLIKQGGFYLNNAKVEEEDRVIVGDDIVEGKLLLLASGKKNKLLVRLE